MHATDRFSSSQRSAGTQRRSRGFRRFGKRAIEREAFYPFRMFDREALGNDCAQGMTHPVGVTNRKPITNLFDAIDEARDAQFALRAQRSSTARQLDADHPMTGQRSEHGCPDSGAAAQTVEANHNIAVALIVDGYTVDENQGHTCPCAAAPGTARLPLAIQLVRERSIRDIQLVSLAAPMIDTQICRVRGGGIFFAGK